MGAEWVKRCQKHDHLEGGLASTSYNLLGTWYRYQLPGLWPTIICRWICRPWTSWSSTWTDYSKAAGTSLSTWKWMISIPLNQPTPCMDPILWNFPTKIMVSRGCSILGRDASFNEQKTCVSILAAFKTDPQKCEEKKLNRNMILILEKNSGECFRRPRRKTSLWVRAVFRVEYSSKCLLSRESHMTSPRYTKFEETHFPLQKIPSYSQ